MKSLSLASVKKLFSKQNMKALMVVTVLLFALMVVTQFSARSLEGFEANSSNFDSTLGTSGKSLSYFTRIGAHIAPLSNQLGKKFLNQ